jgi:hypothetical protein
MKKGPPGGGPRIDAKDNKRSHKLLSTNIARTSRGIRSSRPEQSVQRALLDHLRWRAARDVFYFHVPNGGARHPIEAAIMKGLGVTAGIPDLIIIHNGRTYGLELKSENGRTTDVQLTTHTAMRAAGAVVATTYGLDEALGQLASWHLLRAPS